VALATSLQLGAGLSRLLLQRRHQGQTSKALEAEYTQNDIKQTTKKPK
jgi:hypothetical protein